MKFYYIILISFILSNCSSIVIERPEIRGAIYNSITIKPIKGALINIDDTQLISDNEGKFAINGINKTKIFNFESGHDPIFYFIEIRHPEYNSIYIEKGTRGSFNQKLIIYDSIFLKPIDNKTLLNNGYKCK